MTPAARTTTTAPEALVISAICFGWAVASSLQALGADARLADFTDEDHLGVAGLELVLACVALALLRLRRYDVAGLLPRPSLTGCGHGVMLGAVAWAAGWAATMPFDPGPTADGVASGLSLSPLTVAAVSLVNGTYEEVFLLGFLVRGLRERGPAVALAVSLAVRGLFHLYQGPVGVLSVLVFGLVLSVWFLRTGRLFPAVLAHVLADVVGLAWT
jgi:membrane protease YdiL (CAAX protease family)